MAAAGRFEREFNEALDALLAERSNGTSGLDAYQPVNCYSLCQLREDCLHAAGFVDIFAEVKAAENDRALALLPGLLAEFDGLGGGFAEELELALRGVFAGNIFDLGAAASAELHAAGGGAFAATRAGLLPRPWAVDDLDALLSAVSNEGGDGGADGIGQEGGTEEGVESGGKGGAGGGGVRWRRAALFVDNAGPDVVLGMLPLARVLLKAGTEVLLMANRGPTINDITAAELGPLLARAAQLDPRVLGPAVASGALRVVCSGSDMPVIDLSKLSEEAVEACAGCDLIVLEGMGRAIETNLRARFTCDSLKLGMIKHPEVAAHFPGRRLYDCVCKFDRAAAALQGPAQQQQA